MNLEPVAANAVDPCPSASSVSIVIPTRNRCATLTLCLNALPAGTREVPSLEVIVADDCSSDDTRRRVEEFRNASGWKVIYLRQERPMGANAARNAALNVAGGETIVFIDDDVLVTQGWLYKLLAGLSKECPVVSGPVQLTLEGPIVGRHREEISSYLSEILSAPHGRRGEIVPAACNMAAYRSVFNRARFDETVRPPVEENDWLERAGVKAGFVQDARVWHHKAREEANPRRILAGAWRGGNEGGWWLRDRIKIPSGERRALAKRSLQTSLRAFGHAALRGCWGGAVIGVGELSRALALAGLIKRRRAPQSWR
jgi:glycosyltransferase involved in cell wall biosynthesis